VIERGVRTTCKRPEWLWRCVCDCKTERFVRQGNLRSGHTTSCGCQIAIKTRAANKTHGMTRTTTYTIWRQVKSRCLNSNNPSYSDYGGRGISICKRWEDSFEAFLLDMGERPSDRHSIDRIDNSGDYEPGNCKWSTFAEQNRNYRRNIIIEHNGQAKCLADWADEMGITRHTLRRRIRAGWDMADALTIPVSLSNKYRYRHK